MNTNTAKSLQKSRKQFASRRKRSQIGDPGSYTSIFIDYNFYNNFNFRLSSTISLPPTPITDPEKFGIKSGTPVNKESFSI